MQTLKSNALRVTINPLGAELWSLASVKTGHEYLWQGDPAWWASRATVLFPILCGMRDDAYTYRGKRYTMPKHGFVRGKEFAVAEACEKRVVFEYTDNEATRPLYPFAFLFRVEFEVQGNALHQVYRVVNRGAHEMYFSTGAHEGFNTNWENGGTFEDYYLEFDTEGDFYSEIIAPGGLIDGATYPVIEKGRVLPLRHALFNNDALVFRHVAGRRVFLRSRKTNIAVEYEWGSAPHLGLWQKPGAPYICIEPWHGLPDEVSHDGNIETKFGIIRLEAGEEWTWGHTIRIHE